MGSSATAVRGLAAANKIIKKSVFCIDNVDPKFDESDIEAFVKQLSVTVMSCFSVKPRRRRNETGSSSKRKAFRLCIDEKDRQRLLDPSKWPESVVIFEWYRIPPSGRRSDLQQLHVRIDAASAKPATVSVPASLPASSVEADVSDDMEVADPAVATNNDGDNTIIYPDGVC